MPNAWTLVFVMFQFSPSVEDSSSSSYKGDSSVEESSSSSYKGDSSVEKGIPNEYSIIKPI